MIDRYNPIQVPLGIEYLSDWKDTNGNYVFDSFLSNTPLIVNKQVTGCGFTTYSLHNRENTILVSPRVQLLRNKYEQDSERCFYFNREKKPNGSDLIDWDKLQKDLDGYIFGCRGKGMPLKFLVTYDSFGKLCDCLKYRGLNIEGDFRIVIDEAHCIIKDVPIKEHATRAVISDFLQEVFKYPTKLLFISATPLIDYLQRIPEFQNHYIQYLELEWQSKLQVITRKYQCKSSLDAFEQILEHYKKERCFDRLYDSGNNVYSTEAVIFLNSVADIKKILVKHVVENKNIDLSDVSIICARTKENIEKLRKGVGNGVNILTSIPKEGEQHRTWTFVTRTAFEGVDFYSPCASTYVIANYNVNSLCIDIASDIPQIIGRQRLKSNIFRGIIHLFFTTKNTIISDDLFTQMRKEKEEETEKQIVLYNVAPPSCKAIALENLEARIKYDPVSCYIKIVNGIPVYNEMLVLSEDYSRDILKNQFGWFVLSRKNTNQQLYSPSVQQLKDNLDTGLSEATTEGRIKAVHDWLIRYPELLDEMLNMLSQEQHYVLADIFKQLPHDRIRANGYNITRIKREIMFNHSKSKISSEVKTTFMAGRIYTKEECKTMLQSIYDRLGLKNTAKASDLFNYISCREIKSYGVKYIQILN